MLALAYRLAPFTALVVNAERSVVMHAVARPTCKTATPNAPHCADKVLRCSPRPKSAEMAVMAFKRATKGAAWLQFIQSDPIHVNDISTLKATAKQHPNARAGHTCWHNE